MNAPAWLNQLNALVARNRPSRKPQLWEDPLLSLRRRLSFEINRRVRPTWLDDPHIIALSGVGFPDRDPPPLLEVSPREMINRSLFLYGTFEISETRLLQSLLGPGMSFVDVGANIGYYTVVGARLVGDSGVVHSFEPNHGVRERLEANVKRNAFSNVVVHAEALAGHTGEVTFYASTTESNQGISSILPGRGRTDRQTVASLTLDDFVATLGSRPIDVMKLDIEGAEREVFGGGRRLLSRPDAPALIFEAAELEPVAEVLRDCGYRMRRIHYTLEDGLELRDPAAQFDDLFATYEAPNYFAAKSDDVFATLLARANATRPAALRLLGRI